MRYEWDESKRHANLAKHGVDFADAVGALEGPHNLTVEDRDASGEARYIMLGRGLVEVSFTSCGPSAAAT